ELQTAHRQFAIGVADDQGVRVGFASGFALRQPRDHRILHGVDGYAHSICQYLGLGGRSRKRRCRKTQCSTLQNEQCSQSWQDMVHSETPTATNALYCCWFPLIAWQRRPVKGAAQTWSTNPARLTRY